eukprot:SAG31_NODE_68_length_28153_cov_23.647717_19_plen_72_part_00
MYGRPYINMYYQVIIEGAPVVDGGAHTSKYFKILLVGSYIFYIYIYIFVKCSVQNGPEPDTSHTKFSTVDT